MAARLRVSNCPPSRSIPTHPFIHATVLLVDPEALYRWFVAESLRESGVDVVVCGSLGEAASVLRDSVAPDLLIVDGEMLEGQDGESLRAMREHAGAARCLVLESGGDLCPDRLGRAIVVAKPVDISSVIALVTSQLHQVAPTA
jgi:DNA-binding response OmpR family regulator